MLTILTVFVVLLAPPATLAWNEPDGFRGVKWETTREEAIAMFTQQATKEGKSKPDCMTRTMCLAYLTIGDTHTRGMLAFHEDKFVGVTIFFRAADYRALRPIFIERYGEPTATDIEDFKTKGGLTAKNETLKWVGQRVSISLRAYAGNINDGTGTIMLNSELQRRIEERERTIKKGKDDL